MGVLKNKFRSSLLIQIIMLKSSMSIINSMDALDSLIVFHQAMIEVDNVHGNCE